MSSNEHELDEAFLKEARIGLMVLTVLIATFFYVAYGKLSGWYSPEPLAFQVQPDDEHGQDNLPGNSLSNKDANAFSLHRSADDESKPLRFSRQAETRQPDSFAQQKTTPPRQFNNELSTFDNNRPEVNIVPSEPVAFKPRMQPPIRPRPNVDRATTAIRTSLPKQNVASTVPTGQLSAFTPKSSTRSTTPDDKNAFRAPMIPAAASAKNSLRDSSAFAANNSFAAPKRPTTNPLAKPGNGGAFDPMRNPPTVKPVSATEPIATAAGEPAWLAEKTPATFENENPELDSTTSLSNEPRTNMPSPAMARPASATRLPTSNPPIDPTAPASIVTDDGDSFWLIAQRVYGDGRYFDALYQHNEDRVDSFNDIRRGTELLTPNVEALRERWPRSCPREEFKTTGGETLFDIASERLGQASRYVELLKLNYDRLPKNTDQNTPLPAGVALELPRTR